MKLLTGLDIHVYRVAFSPDTGYMVNKLFELKPTSKAKAVSSFSQMASSIGCGVAAEGCERPCDKLGPNNTDERCLSVVLLNINLMLYFLYRVPKELNSGRIKHTLT
jgi:hypothetical protein